MKKNYQRRCNIIICLAAMSILGFLGNFFTIKAADLAEEMTTAVADLETMDINDLEIAGPECVFAFEKEVSFTLKAKKGTKTEKLLKRQSAENQTDYGRGYSYQWSSSNKKAAKFKETVEMIPGNSCVMIPYAAPDRPNVFKVKAGVAVIQCKIKDSSGRQVILTKKLKVLKGTPLQKVQIGEKRLTKAQRHEKQTVLYSNSHKKNAKIKINVKKGWKVKRVSVDTNANGIYQNITKKKKFSTKTDRDITVNIQLQHKKTGSIFLYNVDIDRYKEHKIALGDDFYDGCGLVCRKTAWNVPMIPKYTVVLKYQKNAKATDPYSFQSIKSLLYKLKKYWGYSDQTVQIKNGQMIYKEAFGFETWTYCTSKASIKTTVKKLERL